MHSQALPFGAVALVLLAGSAVAQTIIHVPGDAPTIQQGIALAQDGDTVLVAPGTYAEAIDYLGKAITVESEAGASVTTIDATGLGSPVASFLAGEGPNSILRGFTLTGGDSNGFSPGAGISCYGSVVAAPLIQTCIIRGNRSFIASGAGVGGNATLEDCAIEDNLTGLGAGGGLFGAPTLRRCIVRGNSAYDAGGLYLLGGSLEDCQILENFSGEGATAGGLTIAGDGVVLTRCVVARNISSGFFQYRVKGAAIYVESGRSVTIVNGTIVANEVVDSGPYPDQNVGGVFGRTTLVNTILGGNDSLEYESVAALTATYSDIEGNFPGVGNFSADPEFVDFLGGDYHLRPDSPCIDAGDPLAPLDPDCTRADVGAFYFAQPCIEVRNGIGVNPLIFSSARGPVVGSTWESEIDASGVPGAENSGVVGRLSALNPGVVLPIGELLIAGPLLFAQFQPSSGEVDSFAFAIPDTPGLIGFEAHVQGIVLGPVSQLTNALRLVVGQ